MWSVGKYTTGQPLGHTCVRSQPSKSQSMLEYSTTCTWGIFYQFYRNEHWYLTLIHMSLVNVVAFNSCLYRASARPVHSVSFLNEMTMMLTYVHFEEGCFIYPGPTFSQICAHSQFDYGDKTIWFRQSRASQKV